MDYSVYVRIVPLALGKHRYVHILASKSVPFRPTMVQMPNLALFETERITVYVWFQVCTLGTWETSGFLPQSAKSNSCLTFDILTT
jgi:hypothetical protein